MQRVRQVGRKSVARRVGGLESKLTFGTIVDIVARRVGGLETTLQSLAAQGGVARRVGGLERRIDP